MKNDTENNGNLRLRASECNGIRTHNHESRKRALIHLDKLASLGERWSVPLETKCLWVRIPFSPLNFRYCACFKKGVPWHSANCKVKIHAKTRTWHDNTQLVALEFSKVILGTRLGGELSKSKEYKYKNQNGGVYLLILSFPAFSQRLEPLILV